MIEINIIPAEDIERIENSSINWYGKLKIISDVCRVNTLSTVKLAGSGHLGSSFSSLDLVTYLYYRLIDRKKIVKQDPNRDIYFSSKGHDVPAHYAVLYSLGILEKEIFLKLRKLGGTHGHPDISIPGIEANSGSLGMGISKAKGMAIAKQLSSLEGQVFVMTGDGELQEGQNFEAIQSASHLGVNNLKVIVDHNKVQSDKTVEEILNIEDLESKFKSFGWYVQRCNGHDYEEIEKVFNDFELVRDQPKVLIADTIKGKGVSFMEHPYAMNANEGIYPWHAGAPDDNSYYKAFEELVENINKSLIDFNLAPVKLENVFSGEKTKSNVSNEYISVAYGEKLVEIGGKRQDLVVLDADLAADCKVRDFEIKYPKRFIEVGIAEQDMVSTAGGLALMGFLPVVNSFGSFLSTRANEQIFNNTTEKTRIIYVCHYAGLIPAGPGQSHQSLRDISLLSSLPNIEILQPCNANEADMVLDYAINESKFNVMIRLNIGPSPQIIDLPEKYYLTNGIGVPLTEGEDFLLLAYGPVMLNEALLAANILKEKGYGLKVINMPWLNLVDEDWLSGLVEHYNRLYVLDDHFSVGGLGDFIINICNEIGLLKNRKVHKFAVEGFAACGSPKEVLQYHNMDCNSIVERLLKL